MRKFEIFTRVEGSKESKVIKILIPSETVEQAYEFAKDYFKSSNLKFTILEYKTVEILEI